MKIRMKLKLLGTLDGVAYPDKGGEWDVPDPVGANLCARGMADPVVEDKTEKAVVPQPEKRGPGRPRKNTEEG